MSKACCWLATQRVAIVIALMIVGGCNSPKPSEPEVKVTSAAERAKRRAYDGAPPVIPHKPLGAACVKCHTTAGMPVPEIGFAPANPHIGTLRAGALTNCKQCHVFKQTEELFADSEFVGREQDLRPGLRQYPGGPPMMPHGELMRENCLACHSGPSARAEIRCSHPERVNCRQCHLLPLLPSEDSWLPSTAALTAVGE